MEMKELKAMQDKFDTDTLKKLQVDVSDDQLKIVSIHEYVYPFLSEEAKVIASNPIELDETSSMIADRSDLQGAFLKMNVQLDKGETELQEKHYKEFANMINVSVEHGLIEHGMLSRIGTCDLIGIRSTVKRLVMICCSASKYDLKERKEAFDRVYKKEEAAS